MEALPNCCKPVHTFGFARFKEIPTAPLLGETVSDEFSRKLTDKMAALNLSGIDVVAGSLEARFSDGDQILQWSRFVRHPIAHVVQQIEAATATQALLR